MSEDNTQENDGPNHPSFIDKILQFFQVDPKDKQELVELFRESEENELIDHDTRDMLEGVMEISEMRVRDIMIPRSQIETIDLDLSLNDVLDIISQTVHSRYPVVSEDKDNIEGILHAKDLLRYLRPNNEEFNLKSILRPAIIIPESKKVDRLLKEFREERYHMAIVVDEFGSVSGVVTIEDILEEIVGEIEDEFDEIEDDIQTFSTHFNDSEVDTVGGLVMNSFGHVPDKGEDIDIKGFQFKVSSSDSRRILQLQVTIPPSSPIPQDIK